MTPFVPFSWKELADLVLISFLLHRLYLLFRGTTALQVAVGGFFLWLLYFAAERAGLVVTTRFFQAMAAVSAVGLIIVFRRELREVLLHTNPLRFFLGQTARPMRVDSEEVAGVAFGLAETKTGCLVCFQKHENVEEFVEEGTELGGRFGAGIVASIFAKESPLHDGAAVVRNGRISRVGALLPLASGKDLPEKFGTRHRAALGLSERCDAVVLVVSEERGEVSLAHRGKLETFADADALGWRFKELLGESKPVSSRRTLSLEGLRQVAGLALAFLMVTVLWNLYLGGGESLISLEIPVELRNVPEGTEVAHNFDETFAVQISGKNPLVEALEPTQVSAFIDLGNLSMGSHTLSIGEGNIRLPPGLRIEQVEPERVEVSMEPRIERELPVRVILSGNPPRGASVSAFVPTPATVRVKGPKSRVERMTHLATVPVSLDELPLVERQEVTVKLGALPDSVSLVEGLAPEVKVAVEMRFWETDASPSSKVERGADV